MLIDTHAHLDYPQFAADLPGVIGRARSQGVGQILAVGTSLASIARCLEIAARHPEIRVVAGIHPTSDEPVPSDLAGALEPLLAHPAAVAVGETGLDYYRPPGAALRATGQPEAMARADALDAEERARQIALFRAHLDLAARLGRNVVIHQRSAWEDTLAILREYTGRLRAVFHCFGGTADQARELLALGHLVSFTGILTFRNAAALRETAAALPARSFMVETDCPYLAPVPFRGKTCEPAHVRLTAECLAESRGQPPEQIARETTATAEDFFGLAPAGHKNS